jgi:hypothetical protein
MFYFKEQIMTKEFKELCAYYNLNVEEDNGNECPFREVIREIYYNWTKEELQSFMNNLMYEEEKYGEALFD